MTGRGGGGERKRPGRKTIRCSAATAVIQRGAETAVFKNRTLNACCVCVWGERALSFSFGRKEQQKNHTAGPARVCVRRLSKLNRLPIETTHLY